MSDTWLTVLGMVRKYGAPMVAKAVRMWLSGSDIKEVARLRDFWVEARRQTWEHRRENGVVYRYCKLCGRWEAQGCTPHCAFEKYPREG
jgi:hypothetical protein